MYSSDLGTKPMRKLWLRCLNNAGCVRLIQLLLTNESLLIKFMYALLFLLFQTAVSSKKLNCRVYLKVYKRKVKKTSFTSFDLHWQDKVDPA